MLSSIEFEAATQTHDELRASLKKTVRHPHGNVHHGKLYLPPDTFSAEDKKTNLCISRFSILDCTGNMHIGPWCMIGARTRIYTHDHIHDSHTPLLHQQEEYGVIWQDKYIGKDVWIHENVIVLYQVTVIPDGAVIGAGAVLTKNPGPYEIWGGIPARKIADRRDMTHQQINELVNQNKFTLREHLKESWETTDYITF